MSDTTTPPADVLLLGDPGLRRMCRRVDDVGSPEFRHNRDRLHATLAAFRAEHGFGRAVSAPQIGVDQRFIAVNLGEAPFSIINPEITWRSPETFTMWDDCMSFPFLLVRVRRHCAISVRYVDDGGDIRVMDRLDRPTSELLQHEIDHLNGVLAVDHALDANAIISRDVFEANQAWFTEQVDYLIEPTISQSL